MKITSITIKQDRNGNDYKVANTDDDRNFGVFPFHSQFKMIETGLELPDSALEKDGKYWKLTDPEQQHQERKTGGFSRGNDSRSEQIRVAQDHKSESIAYFNAVNSAIAVLGTFKTTEDWTSDTEVDYKGALRGWRDWFLSEWKEHKDPKNETPF